MRKFILFLALALLTMTMAFSFPATSDIEPEETFSMYRKLTPEDTEKVFKVFRALKQCVYDMDNNGDVSCYDYTMIFLKIWCTNWGSKGIDMVVVDKPAYVLIGNYAPRVFHSFIRIKSGGKWCYIEPQATNRPENTWTEAMYMPNFWKKDGTYATKEIYPYIKWWKRGEYCRIDKWYLPN